MSDKDSEKRFKEVYNEVSAFTGNKIMVDRETGVHYLFSWSGYAGGLTPLLDKDGKPVIKSNNE